jgi:hypothetical protein
MILDEVTHRLKRKAFDDFINAYIEYPLYKTLVYITCYPTGNLQRSEPDIGWAGAEEVRDRYYFDEILFNLHMGVAHVLSNTQDTLISSSVHELARSSNRTYTLMSVMAAELRDYLF